MVAWLAHDPAASGTGVGSNVVWAKLGYMGKLYISKMGTKRHRQRLRLYMRLRKVSIIQGLLGYIDLYIDQICVLRRHIKLSHQSIPGIPDSRVRLDNTHRNHH